MINVAIPKDCIPERKYICEVLFQDFLGLSLHFEDTNSTNTYIFTLPNGNELIIEDHFFSKFSDSKNYLLPQNIPNNVLFEKNQFAPSNDIPILYGTTRMEISGSKIVCGNDIMASSFFMLTRWEEYVISERDKLGRFCDENSLAHKFNFFTRPIVNEYCEMIWKMLIHLGYKGVRKLHNYKIILTHDIDFFERYDTFNKLARAILGDIFKRKSLLLPFKTLFDYLLIKVKIKTDPYNTYDFFMDIAEKFNTKSYFNFIPSIPEEHNCNYDILDEKVIKTINHIIHRGHFVGIHGSILSSYELLQFKTELNRLKKIHPNIFQGRQHYLLFKNPNTWQTYEECMLQFDSTLGYHCGYGFRCGCCYSYPVFNIITRKQLNVIEYPLIAMDTKLFETFPKITDFKNILTTTIQTVKKYNGNFVFLWHNNNVNMPEWKKLSQIIISTIQ